LSCRTPVLSASDRSINAMMFRCYARWRAE